jgi:lipoprotein-anchoring transpeptidase ErfK/SrfK
VHRWAIRALTLTVIGALVVAGLVAWHAPHTGPPQEGGRGHTTAAAPAAPYRPAPARRTDRLTGSGRQPAPVPLPHLQPAPVPAAPTFPYAGPTLIATVRAATNYRLTPSLGAPIAGTLPGTNPFGAAQVLAVLGSPTSTGWLHVELPVRPNGSTGWIPAGGVSLAQTSYHVFVNLEDRTVTVTDAGRPLVSAPATVGKPSTPTPPGQTYLWELIRPDDPQGAYGPYIFGLGWFSDAYAVFNGGDAQIGIHGQDEPDSLGRPVSHGCVRLPNDIITRLAGLLPLGTPVTIS